MLNNTRFLQKISLHPPDKILYPDNGHDDEESDSEDEEHGVDGLKEVPVFDEEDMEEPKEDHNDPGLLGRIAQRFMNKFPVLQTRSGRAGRVHNYLRGLGLAFAPVPFGESPSFAELKAKSNELFFLKRKNSP